MVTSTDLIFPAATVTATATSSSKPRHFPLYLPDRSLAGSAARFVFGRQLNASVTDHTACHWPHFSASRLRARIGLANSWNRSASPMA